MEPQTIERMGQVLGSAYPRWEANEGTFLVFNTVLEGLDPNAVLAACWAWVRKERFPPSAAELRLAAEQVQQYLDEGPEIELIRLRVGGYDCAFGPKELQTVHARMDMRYLLKETGELGDQHLADAIEQQTGGSVAHHLEEWGKQAQAHSQERREAVAKMAQGWESDVPLRITAGNTTFVEDDHD